jgi:hypothetical protein
MLHIGFLCDLCSVKLWGWINGVSFLLFITTFTQLWHLCFPTCLIGSICFSSTSWHQKQKACHSCPANANVCNAWDINLLSPIHIHSMVLKHGGTCACNLYFNIPWCVMYFLILPLYYCCCYCKGTKERVSHPEENRTHLKFYFRE